MYIELCMQLFLSLALQPQGFGSYLWLLVLCIVKYDSKLIKKQLKVKMTDSN